MTTHVDATTVPAADLPTLAGRRLGTSGWHRVTQAQVNLFAEATGDHQWIHVDPERAASGPFAGTIAHGYLTLSLAPVLLAEIVQVTAVAQVVNYGVNRVRFPAPLPAGSQMRMTADCTDVAELPDGYQVTLGLTFERESSPKPVCVAETVFRFYPEAGHERA
jgi:acyl dehydratase